MKFLLHNYKFSKNLTMIPMPFLQIFFFLFILERDKKTRERKNFNLYNTTTNFLRETLFIHRHISTCKARTVRLVIRHF